MALENPSEEAFQRSVPLAFSVRTRLAGRVAIVEVAGECDLARADELRSALDLAIEADGAGVILDLTEVEFFDSSALGAVAFGWKKAQQLGRRLSVVISKSVVRRPFDLTGLDKLLTISGTLGEAFAELRRQP